MVILRDEQGCPALHQSIDCRQNCDSRLAVEAAGWLI